MEDSPWKESDDRGKRMAELMIRRAEERDIEAIEGIEQQCFSMPWTYESLRHDILENKLSFYIVAEVEGTICGYVGIWKILDEGHINNVAVAPDFRRKHIASNLLDVLVETCSQAGVERFTLEVRDGNQAARRLYKAKGFVEAGLRKGYYEDNGEDAFIMWKDMSAGMIGSGGASERGAGGSNAGEGCADSTGGGGAGGAGEHHAGGADGSNAGGASEHSADCTSECGAGYGPEKERDER